MARSIGWLNTSRHRSHYGCSRPTARRAIAERQRIDAIVVTTTLGTPIDRRN
jgi:hypothetical protein